MTIPHSDLTTLFLDVGNTLNSVDFPWICDELGKCGISCGIEELRRAEAKARPAISEGVKHLSHEDGNSVFRFYLRTVLGNVASIGEMPASDLGELVAGLEPVLRPPGSVAADLWSYVLPGVDDALGRLKQAGLRLAVVSNADGTVEHALSKQGLRDHFEIVVDSRRVGFEKPDPRIFQYALDAMGVTAQETLHIGDMFDVDIVGARSVGLHALLIDPFGDWDHVDCDRLRDLSELADIIAPLGH